MDDDKTSELLKAWRAGDIPARDCLVEHLYKELNAISRRLLLGEGNASLMSGDLVNEAIMRLLKTEKIEIADRAHFLSLAARTMRRILVDHSRMRKTDKRHHEKVTLATFFEGHQDSLDVQELELALIRLKVINEDRAALVEMRYYGGMTPEEIAIVLGCSASTVKREWRAVRSWLLETIEEQKAL